MAPREHPAAVAPDARAFATTRWSMVLRAGGAHSHDSASALTELCRAYWYPLYSFARRLGLSHHDAEDLIQGYFAHLLEKDVIARADRERGRFRTFLLSSLKNFHSNLRARAASQKRGGGQAPLSLDDVGTERRYTQEPATVLSPERLFDRQWAVSLLERVVEKLRREYAAAGKAALFDELCGCLWGGQGESSYHAISSKLGTTEGAIKVAVYRLRGRYRECLQRDVADTVGNPAEIDDELRYLLQAVGPEL